MFDEVNNLPADDPLRAPANAQAAEASANDKPVVAAAPRPASRTQGVLNLLPAKVLAAFRANGGASMMADESDASAKLPAPKIAQTAQEKDKGSVVVDAGLRVPVPSFEGGALRSVVEKADSVGLRVQAVGSGLAREQVPAAATMVPSGTEVVVRFTR